MFEFKVISCTLSSWNQLFYYNLFVRLTLPNCWQCKTCWHF